MQRFKNNFYFYFAQTGEISGVSFFGFHAYNLEVCDKNNKDRDISLNNPWNNSNSSF